MNFMKIPFLPFGASLFFLHACLSANAGVVTFGTTTSILNSETTKLNKVCDIPSSTSECQYHGGGQELPGTCSSSIDNDPNSLGPWYLPVPTYSNSNNPDVVIDGYNYGAVISGSSTTVGSSELDLQTTFQKPSWSVLKCLIHVVGGPVDDSSSLGTIAFNGDLELVTNFSLCDTAVIDLYALLASENVSIGETLDPPANVPEEFLITFRCWITSGSATVWEDTLTIDSEDPLEKPTTTIGPFCGADYTFHCRMKTNDTLFNAQYVKRTSCNSIYLWSTLDQGSVTLFIHHPLDLDGSGQVDFGDIGLVLLSFGECEGCAADIDKTGTVDGGDVGQILLCMDYIPCESSSCDLCGP
ncbi:MAG: hypothetical protein K8R92_10580 [Planctomycetes bacterium]|nr:hypothetical protein [Planctomycetota bacterium]